LAGGRIAAAANDVRALLYLLVEMSMPTEMLIWAGEGDCTVNKQRNLNLRFSSMSYTESKIVHVSAENIITLYE
jgi:hypothetical protein